MDCLASSMQIESIPTIEPSIYTYLPNNSCPSPDSTNNLYSSSFNSTQYYPRNLNGNLSPSFSQLHKSSSLPNINNCAFNLPKNSYSPESNSSKPLFLSIQPSQFTPNSGIKNPENNLGKYYGYPENFLHGNLMQGPNTNEYFGHGNETAEQYYVESDGMDVPLDPYDNTTEEQKFCGGYGEWGHVVNNTDRTILPDLKPYSYPDDIKNQADVIYNKMRYQVRRGKVRHQMLFFCVYCAHLELGRDVNPVQLGSQFGLIQGEVQRCDSLFSPLQTGYKPPSANVSPLGYLPDYCENMDLSQEAITEIMKMSINILRKDPTLYQENPQTVAAGFLRYYTITNGITTDDPQKITRVTGRSTVTIDGMFRRISTIDNN